MGGDWVSGYFYPSERRKLRMAKERPTEKPSLVTQELRKKTTPEKWTMTAPISSLSFLTMLSNLSHP